MNALHPPAASGRGRGSCSLVQGDLALDSPDVVEERLDLDHEQCSRPSIEGEDVDPPANAARRDLDLANHGQARGGQTPAHVGGAARVDEVALAHADGNRASPGELEVEPERRGKTVDHRDRGVGRLGLDHGDIGARDPGGPAELALGDVEAQASRVDELPDGAGKCCGHG